MSAARYFDLVREMNNSAFGHRSTNGRAANNSSYLRRPSPDPGVRSSHQSQRAALYPAPGSTVRSARDPVHRTRCSQRDLSWAFADRRSTSASAVFASRIQQHLDRYGVSLRDLVWQADNGGEFKGDFSKALGDSQHVRIPPAARIYQLCFMAV
jgi:hypothetical protein